MKMEEKQIKEILLGQSFVSEEDMKIAEANSKRKKSSVVDELLTSGVLVPDLLGQALAEFYKVPYSDLNSNLPSREQVKKIPEGVAKKLRVVLFKEEDKEVVITTDNPTQKTIATAVKTLFKGKKIKITYSLPEDIDLIFSHYQKGLDTRFAQIIKKQGKIAPEIIDEIFKDALSLRTSDIHFEPQDGPEVIIRFRVDGVLYEAGRVTKEYYENILNRIKVMSNMRIDEHNAAQDGAIRYVTLDKEKQKIDMRVSVAPILDGEKVTIRLLSSYVRSFGLGDLGLSHFHQQKIISAGKKPFGMVLVTGPTGSGKTTTLYALLKHVNRPEVNITTIEDPVEYRLGGANQIQVNVKTDLTFAKGLRSIVRQDPDIILVGEIRDQETADIAINAALTGHLLFSTFHANDAATAIPRMLDMGVEPFLLASTLEVMIAQRLVRKICDHCRTSYTTTPAEIEKVSSNTKQYFSGKKITLYKGKGCEVCNQTGYKGRMAIYEFIEMTEQMQDLILGNPSSQEIWELARGQGSTTLFEDGIEKIKNGITTIEELRRVAEPPTSNTKYAEKAGKKNTKSKTNKK
jgi:type II secretory ATPase GspE/PulE/Tfp pilus assembly ATPase PilB-like protein